MIAQEFNEHEEFGNNDNVDVSSGTCNNDHDNGNDDINNGTASVVEDNELTLMFENFPRRHVLR